MKTNSYLIYALCAFMQSCDMIDAQVVWLSTGNPDFSDSDREERTVERFDAISNTCPFDVIYEQSDKQYVIVEGDEKVFGRLHTDVRRGVLEISIEPARYRNVRLRLKVGCPDIKSILMAGSGSVICSSDIVTDADLDVRVSGSGDIVAKNIKCADFESSVAGSGDLRIARIVADDVSLDVAGSGDWGAERIKARNLSISLAGSGDVEIINVDIEDTLSASLAGSGDIDVNGKARNVSAKIVGSGDISGRISYDKISKVKAGSGDIDW